MEKPSIKTGQQISIVIVIVNISSSSSILMYGAAESWALTEVQGAQLETFHNGCLRQIMGLHRGPDGPSTFELLARTSQHG